MCDTHLLGAVEWVLCWAGTVADLGGEEASSGAGVAASESCAPPPPTPAARVRVDCDRYYDTMTP